MCGHLLKSSGTDRHMAGRRLGTMLYGTVSRTGWSTGHLPHKLTEKRHTCRDKASMLTSLLMLVRRGGPAFDGRSILKHLQSQIVSEQENMERAMGERSIQISFPLPPSVQTAITCFLYHERDYNPVASFCIL